MDKIIEKLKEKFDNVEFAYKYDAKLQKNVIYVNNFDLYKSKRFVNIGKVLKKKFKNEKFFFVYLNFKVNVLK